MSKNMHGKHAIISGGTSGINLEIASQFAQLGANVTIFGRDQQKADKAAAEITSSDNVSADQILAGSADVRNYDDVYALAAKAHDKFGPIDIAIAGAAGNFPVPAVDLSPNGFKTVIDIDLLGTFHVFKAAFDFAQKESASFIAISAEQATNPHPLQAHVCAAKAGVNMLVKVLAMEWGPAGIRVNAIVPGPIDGTEGMARLTPTPEARQNLEKRIPLQRYGTKTEIADLATFLSSNNAAYINGSIIECDGGGHLGGLAPSFARCSAPRKKDEQTKGTNR